MMRLDKLRGMPRNLLRGGVDGALILILVEVREK